MICCQFSAEDVAAGFAVAGALIMVATCRPTRAPEPTEIDTSVVCEEGGGGGGECSGEEDAGLYRDPASALSDEESPRYL